MADRVLRAGVAVLVVAVVGVGGVVVVEHLRDAPAGAAGASVPTGTATVERTDLATTTQVDGTLGYAGSYPLVNQADGIYTALPALGQTLTRGQPLYEVSGRPIVLWYGARPAWRDLALGVGDGPDISQLKQNLVALGFASHLTDTGHFDLATAAAVRRWQAALGVPVTGTVGIGDVVYAPGPVRVSTVQVALGDAAHPGQFGQASGTTAVVNLSVPVTQEYLLRVGDQVTVTLPDGTTTTPGTITSVSKVASSTGGQNGAPAQQSGPGSGQAAVNVTVALANPAVAGSLDQAPVQVNVTDQAVHGVLAVPINALVALAEGGYGIWVLDHGTRRLVGVRTGLFASSLVQVSGTGLAAGMTVEVPAS